MAGETQLGALNNQPDNVNFLSPVGFNFFIKKLPNTNYFCQAVNIPSVQLGDADIMTPLVRLPLIGDHLEYGLINVNFKVDEDMTNYVELYNWITQLGFPESTDQSKFIYEKAQATPSTAAGSGGSGHVTTTGPDQATMGDMADRRPGQEARLGHSVQVTPLRGGRCGLGRAD